MSKGVDQLVANVRTRVEQRNAATQMVVRKTARDAERYMKTHHRWQNRTRRAEQDLKAHAEIHGHGRERHTEYDLVLTSGAPYAKWLESHHGAAYGHRAGMSLEALTSEATAGPLSILWPTLRLFRPRLMRAVRAVRAVL